MYTKSKKALCVFLAVLCLCFCVLPQLTPRAEAVGPVTLAVGAVALLVFGMMGLQFASTQAAYDAAGAFYKSDKSVSADLESLAANFSLATGSGLLGLNPSMLQTMIRLIAKAKEFFSSDKPSIDIPKATCNYDNFSVLNYEAFASVRDEPKLLFDYAQFDNTVKPSLSLNNVAYNYDIQKVRDRNSVFFRLRLNSDIVYFAYADDNSSGSRGAVVQYDNYSDYSLIEPKFGFHLSADSKFLIPYIAVRTVNKSSGLIDYKASCLLPPYTYSNQSYPCDAELLSAITDNVAYNLLNISIDTLTAAIEGLKDTIGDIALDISDLYNSLTDTAEGAQEGEQEQTVPYIPSLEWLKKMLLDMGVTADLINKITAGATDVNNPAGSITLDEVDPDIPQLPDLTDKFPFCIPFDLIALVTALNAAAECPRFTVPIDMGFVNYHDTVVIDFRGFEKAAAVIRWGTTIFFILGLIVVTRKMIQA